MTNECVAREKNLPWTGSLANSYTCSQFTFLQIIQIVKPGQ